MRIYEPLGLAHTYIMICQPVCENDLEPENFSAYGPCSYLHYDLKPDYYDLKPDYYDLLARLS